MCEMLGIGRISMDKSDAEKNRIMQEGISMLRKCEMAPDALYDALRASRRDQLTDELEVFLAKYQIVMDPFSFFCIWLPYQIRCKYFHTNSAIPLFSYAAEPMMEALRYTNCFVERFVEETLPEWLAEKNLTEEQSQRIEKAYRALKNNN